MAAIALLVGSVMNRERQSDNQKNNREDLVIGHDHHPPFVEKRVKAKHHLFPSCREALRLRKYYIMQEDAVSI